MFLRFIPCISRSSSPSGLFRSELWLFWPCPPGPGTGSGGDSSSFLSPEEELAPGAEKPLSSLMRSELRGGEGRGSLCGERGGWFTGDEQPLVTGWSSEPGASLDTVVTVTGGRLIFPDLTAKILPS